MNPESLLFSKTHEWLHVQQKVATMGITAFAVEQLTDLVFIELPQPGRKVRAGESFGEIESVKAVSDLYSPVTGEVVEVNQQLADALEWFSEDPYGRGWIAKIRIEDETSLKDLMDYAAYQQQCAEEA